MSEQTYVSEPTSVFSGGRFAVAGWSDHMNFVYDKKAARNGRLCEWDFYQILSGDIVLQLSMGHGRQGGRVSAKMFDLKSGEEKEFSHGVFNVGKLRKNLDANPEKPGLLQFFCPTVKMQFEVASRYRRLTLTQIKGDDIRTEIDVTLTNATAAKEKAVVAIPSENPKRWYLASKENNFVAKGYARIEGMEATIDGSAVFCWERFVLPRKTGFVWGNGSTSVEGVNFAFNIGWGFGNTEKGTENMFFYDNKVYKLSDVHEAKVGDGFRYADDEKNFVFEAQPFFDNSTQIRHGFRRETRHQIFGIWKGTVKLPDGTKVKIPPFVAFCIKGEK